MGADIERELSMKKPITLLGVPFLYGIAGCRNMGKGPTHFWNVPFHCIVCGNLTSTSLKGWEKRRGVITRNGKTIKISNKDMEKIKLVMDKNEKA